MADGCQCNWKKCRKDCKCRCHTLAEAHATHGYKLGISVGLEQAGGILMNEAADSFTNGHDEEAQMLRQLSKKLGEQGKKAHPGPHVDYNED